MPLSSYLPVSVRPPEWCCNARKGLVAAVRPTPCSFHLGRGPPGPLYGPELQALSNSLQLTSI